MATLGRLGGLGAGVKAEASVSKPLGRLGKAWEITKLLMKNDFTRLVSNYCAPKYIKV